jgi:hypothetical protein
VASLLTSVSMCTQFQGQIKLHIKLLKYNPLALAPAVNEQEFKGIFAVEIIEFSDFAYDLVF